MAEGLRVTIARTEAELLALGDDYRVLAGSRSVTLPFETFEWHVTWWRSFATDEWAVRDSLRIMVVRRGDRCVAIAPFLLSERPSIGPFRLRLLQLLGADPNYTEIRSVLFDPAFEESSARALLAHLSAARDEWDVVKWSGVRVDSPFAHVLEEDRDAARSADNAHFILDLPNTFAELRAGLKRNIRESLRHGYNSLKRAGHVFSLRVAETPDEIASLLPRFYELHRLRSTLGETVHHADRFALRGGKEFLNAIAQALGQRGVFKIFALHIDEEIVALRLGFVLEKQLYLYYSGFDPRWARFGVMTTTLAETMRWAIERGLRSIDLSTGSDVSKTRWAPRSIGFHDVTQASPSSRGAVASTFLSAGTQLRTGGLARLLPLRRWE